MIVVWTFRLPQVVMINRDDMARMALNAGDQVSLVCDVEKVTRRCVDGLSIQPFNLPDGCIAGYYPEMNPLIPLWYR